MKTFRQLRCPLLSIVFMALFSFTPAFAQTTLVVEPGEPVLDGVISPGEWTSASLVTTRGVTLQAMADGEFLYLAASWADETESIAANRITYDGSQWSQSGNEDRIAFLFDMGQTGADGVNCQAFCHFPGMSTNGGIVDVWNWQAARSNPMGYSEDTYWDPAGQQVDEGVSAVLINSLDGQNLPGFMATTDPGAIMDFLVENAAAMDAFDPFGTQENASVEEAVSFNGSMSFNTNDYIPGYIHRVPSGDIADVRSAGKYNNGTWTVEFKRKYEGSEHDFNVAPGGMVDFAHEVFDNQGGDHAIDSTPIDGKTYTLDFSNIAATSIERTDTEIPSSFELQQNYPNPFNPATTISFSIAETSFARLEIVNLLGQEVAVLMDEIAQPGHYTVDFDAQSLPSGVYYYRLVTDKFTASRSMMLMK